VPGGAASPRSGHTDGDRIGSPGPRRDQPDAGQHRSEEGPISLSNPAVILALIIVGAWVGVVGWKQQRKENARGVGGNGGYRRGTRREAYDEYDDGYPGGYDDGYRYPDYNDEPRRGRSDSRADGGLDRTRAIPFQGRGDRARADNTRPDNIRAEKPRGGPAGGDKRAEVEINPGKCARFAFCEHEAPEVFKLVGDRIDYRTSVPDDQIAAVEMAVKVCPARAIKMKRAGSKPYLPQPYVDDEQRRPVRR
jgi:ferredoxin